VREVAATGESFDRVVLDLPEPWAVLPEVGGALLPGGIICTYLPTTNQVQEAVLALQQGAFGEIETFEVLLRSWHVTDRSVRPDHRMVAHTGFLTIARKMPTDVLDPPPAQAVEVAPGDASRRGRPPR
jgi:tRNA (adenine57-N1/adenine58-N1)-methyltransferase